MGLTHFPNGISSMGVPMMGNAGHNICLGKIWFVNGTSGSDGNNGELPTQAFKTIQKAITTQIAQTSSLGDIIYVAAGNYLGEELSGNLTKVSIVGLSTDYPWGAVIVGPEDASAYTGDMNNAMFKNICFMSPGTSSKTLPAVHLGNMRYSVIEDCHFMGRDPTCITGLQIGPETDVATTVHMDYCIIRRNHIGTWMGSASEFANGIKLGTIGGTTGDGNHICNGTKIEYNDIYALTYGIALNVAVDTADHTIIRGNVIDSVATANGCAQVGIYVENSAKVMIVNNRVNADDGIEAGSSMRILGNIVANAGAPAGENPIMND